MILRIVPNNAIIIMDGTQALTEEQRLAIQNSLDKKHLVGSSDLELPWRDHMESIGVDPENPPTVEEIKARALALNHIPVPF